LEQSNAKVDDGRRTGSGGGGIGWVCSRELSDDVVRLAPTHASRTQALTDPKESRAMPFRTAVNEPRLARILGGTIVLTIALPACRAGRATPNEIRPNPTPSAQTAAASPPPDAAWTRDRLLANLRSSGPPPASSDPLTIVQQAHSWVAPTTEVSDRSECYAGGCAATVRFGPSSTPHDRAALVDAVKRHWGGPVFLSGPTPEGDRFTSTLIVYPVGVDEALLQIQDPSKEKRVQ
jgi:hypothetical protein